jgi:RNA polymerase sigma factor (sigma-70 family)
MKTEESELESISDEELMHRYRLGQSKAFDELYRRYSGRVYGFLLKRVSSVEAGEVFQETFLRLHRYRDNYDRSCRFAVWLFAICRSAAIDAQRRSGRQQSMIDNQAAVESIAKKDVSTIRDAIKPLSDAVADLPSREARALMLRYGDDLSFNQLAAQLRMSEPAARKIVSRAVARLRKMLK